MRLNASPSGPEVSWPFNYAFPLGLSSSPFELALPVCRGCVLLLLECACDVRISAALSGPEVLWPFNSALSLCLSSAPAMCASARTPADPRCETNA